MPPSPDEDEIFVELRPRGMTDDFGVPVIFRGGGADSLSVSTRRPDGFRVEDLAVIQRIVRPLARVLEATGARLAAAHGDEMRRICEQAGCQERRHGSGEIDTDLPHRVGRQQQLPRPGALPRLQQSSQR